MYNETQAQSMDVCVCVCVSVPKAHLTAQAKGILYWPSLAYTDVIC